MKSSEAVKRFFDLLGRDEDEAAMGVFRSLAFPDGVDAPPSPAARDAMATGEWEAKLSVSLYCVSVSSCGKRIGTTDPVKVCVKNSLVCSVKAHQVSKKQPVSATEFGWRIGVGTTAAEGVYAVPFLSPSSSGGSGPISDEAEPRLYDTDGRPFTMPVAHWRMLFSIYLEDTVLAGGTPMSGESGSSSGIAAGLTLPGTSRVPKSLISTNVPFELPTGTKGIPSQFSFDASPLLATERQSESQDDLNTLRQDMRTMKTNMREMQMKLASAVQEAVEIKREARQGLKSNTEECESVARMVVDLSEMVRS